MASTPKTVLPPHLRLRAAQPAAPVTLDPITPLTVVYGNVVGNETVKEPELKTTKPEPDNIKCEPKTTQMVDRVMAEAWWAKLSSEQKIGIAEPYILEGRGLPTASVHKPASKSGLNPAVPSFSMGALREVVPNVPAPIAKQDEWGSLSFAAKQDGWNTDASTKTNDWNISPTQATMNEWGSSSAAPAKAAPVKVTAAPAKATAAPVKVGDWNTSPTQATMHEWGSSSTAPVKATPVKATAAPVKVDDWNISPTQVAMQLGSSPAAPVKATAAPVKAMAAPVKADGWNTSSTTSTKQGNWGNWGAPSQPLISIDSESPTAQTNEALVEAEKLTPPHKSAWIGLKSNGEEQDEFIRVSLQTFLGHVYLLIIIQFMTAKVFPRLTQSTPKKPTLDTTYVTENPDPAPADDYASVASNSFSSDW